MMTSKSEGKVVRWKLEPKPEDIMPIIEAMWPTVEVDEPTMDEKLQSVMDDKPWIIFIVDNKDGMERGYLLLTKPEIDIAHCPLFFVHEVRKGYGSTLFQTACDYAHCTIRLGTKLNNEVAIKFYDALGPSSAEVKRARGEKHYEWTYLPPRRRADSNLGSTIKAISQATRMPEVRWVYQRMDASYGEAIEEEGTPNNDDMFCIGSLSKPFTNATFVKILKERGMSLDDKILNFLGGILHDTTFRELLVHVNGLPQINDLLLGPDGTVLISDWEEFLRAAKSLRQSETFEYSNSNTIAVGFLIQELSGLPAGQAIKEKLIIPLGLSRTCSTEEDFERLKKYVMKPHVVNTNQEAIPIEHPHYFGINAASMGIYSSLKDLLKFFHALMKGGIEGLDPKEFFASYVQSETSYSFFGHCIPLSKIGRGIDSINQIGSPSASYSLGDRWKHLRKDYIVHHKQGAVTGFTCAVALQLKTREAIVVLTNASGLVDAADYIFRAIIQKTSGFQDADAMEVDIPAAVEIGRPEVQQWFTFSFPMSSKEEACKLVYKFPNLDGLFIGKGSIQSLYIDKVEDHYEVAVAGSGGRRRSKSLWLFPDKARNGSVLIRPQPSIDIAMLGIDIRDSWFPLLIQVHRTDEGIIKTLTRESRHRPLVYTRVENAEQIGNL